MNSKKDKSLALYCEFVYDEFSTVLKHSDIAIVKKRSRHADVTQNSSRLMLFCLLHIRFLLFDEFASCIDFNTAVVVQAAALVAHFGLGRF